MARMRMEVQRKRLIFLPAILLLLVLLASGCSSHDSRFSYFNMLSQEKGNERNRKAAEKFWSSVRPVSTLSASHYKLGRHYQEQGKYAKAIEEFAKAVKNDPDYCKAYNGMAMSHDALKECRMAHEAYELGLRCAPQEAYLYNNYGCSSLLCDDLDKGLALFRKAAELSGDSKQVMNNLKLAQAAVHRKNGLGKQLSQKDASPVEIVQPGIQGTDVQAVEVAVEKHPDAVSPPNFEKQESAQKSVLAGSIMIEPVVEAVRQDDSATAVQQTSLTESSVNKTAIVVKPIQIRTEHASLHGVVEVSNGNGVSGMAHRSAGLLRSYGFTVGRITNADHFNFHHSIIFYREGHLQAAQELAQVIPGTPEMKKTDFLGRETIGVRLLLGRDLIQAGFPEEYAGILDDVQSEKDVYAGMTVLFTPTLAN